jgi:hypothetical protein
VDRRRRADAVAGDPTGQLDGDVVVQDDEVDTGRKRNVERGRGATTTTTR